MTLMEATRNNNIFHDNKYEPKAKVVINKQLIW